MSRRFDGNDLALNVSPGGNNDAVVDRNRKRRLRINGIAFVIGFGGNSIHQGDGNARARRNYEFTGTAMRALRQGGDGSIFRLRLWRYLRLGAILSQSESGEKHQRNEDSHRAPP